MYLNIAAYKFVPLEHFADLREPLRENLRRRAVKGTVMLSPEGINCFLAGAETPLREFLAELRQHEAFADLEVKESYSHVQPFRRLLVKLKKEIIAFGVEGIEPAKRTSPKLPAEALKQWLDEGRDVTLLDVRNDYEVEVGTFSGAVPIQVDHFRDFPQAVDRLPASLKAQPVVMFCTGGIRCEKAGPLMESKGFQQVYQLDGGILKYFERCGKAHYQGDCFVFDGRVAVDAALQPSDVTQCFACQAVVRPQDQQHPHYIPGKSCPQCYVPPEEQRRRRIEKRLAELRRLTTPLPGSVPYTNRRPLNIPQRYDGGTLLETLCRMHPHIDEATWRGWFNAGHIVRGQVPVRPHRRVRGGDSYGHLVPETTEPDVNAEIQILYEDEALVAVAKPAPLPMHPCGRFNKNTLLSLLNQVYAPEVLRPGHRLDANTTGIVVLSRKRKYAHPLQSAFQQQTAQKTYLARCHGHPAEASFRCDAPIARQASVAGGRGVDADGLPAETEFRVLRCDADGTALLEVLPRTGRTNQIRVHLWHLGWPIVGDPLYRPEGRWGRVQTGEVRAAPMQLHAWRVRLPSPLDGHLQTFVAPVPSWAGDRELKPAAIVAR